MQCKSRVENLDRKAFSGWRPRVTSRVAVSCAEGGQKTSGVIDRKKSLL